MSNPSPHQMMTCPYNQAHQVEHYRMQVHLGKCRRQHKNCNKVSCPFDTTHIVNDVEIDYHVSVCPKRYMLDTKMYVIDDDTRPPVEVQPMPSAITCEENWEEDVATSYVPDLSKKAPHIITKIKGATPSERRKHRMEGDTIDKQQHPLRAFKDVFMVIASIVILTVLLIRHGYCPYRTLLRRCEISCYPHSLLKMDVAVQASQ